ncbi:MAG: SapC family protein [Beijerinckiaceae bacterium]
MDSLDRFASLYDRPEPLAASFAHERIYAPPSYALVREAQVVPAVHVEALAMAAWFPVCWRRGEARHELVILRSLSEGAQGAQPPGSPSVPASLPLVLRSYPVAIHPRLGDNGAVMVERAVADHPTDAGAPMALADGRPSRGLLNRFRSALIARHAAALTDAMTEALMAIDAFRDWSLDLPTAAGRVSLEGFLHVPGEALDGEDGRRLVARFGIDIVALLAAHRLSLFRIGDLRLAFERRSQGLAA